MSLLSLGSILIARNSSQIDMLNEEMAQLQETSNTIKGHLSASFTEDRKSFQSPSLL